MDYILGLSTSIIFSYFFFLNAFFLLKQQNSILDYFSNKYPLFMTRNRSKIESFYIYLVIPVSGGLIVLSVILIVLFFD